MLVITLPNGRTVLARVVFGELRACEYANRQAAARRAMEVCGQAVQFDFSRAYFVAVDEEARAAASVRPRDESFITEPQEITEEQYLDGLSILPPTDFHIFCDSESFKWTEHVCGRVTRIYCRIGRRHFYMHNLASLRHDEIVTIVRAALAAPATATR
jgi:hypothetical protein